MSTQSPTALPSPSSSSSTSPQNSPLSNTSTLLFGFLVSALTIFALFMTVAIIWNRLVARRRAIDALLALNPPLYSRQLHRPTMWDVWVVPDEQVPPWLDAKPVAAQKCDDYATFPETTQSMSFWRHALLEHLPPEITYLFCQPIPISPVASNDGHVSQVELSHGSDIQISLLICMPRAPHSKQEHEMLFATTSVSYHESGPS